MRFRRSISIVAALVAFAGCARAKTWDDTLRVAGVEAHTARLTAPQLPKRAFNVKARPPHTLRTAPALNWTPQQRENFRRWMNAWNLNRWYAAMPVVTRWGAPAPISSLRCPPGPIKDELDRTFGIAAPWVESVAMRESHCTATAYNRSGASGVLQMMMPMHSGLVAVACPGRNPSEAVFDPRCNIAAAFSLFVGGGVGPWRL